MRRYLIFFLLCANAHAGEAEQVFKMVRDSVVTLTVYDERKDVDGMGSGVVVAAERVVTNCHVVQEAVAIRVRAGDKEWDASIGLMDTPHDLCQLEVPGLKAAPVKIRSHRDVKIGEAIYAVGNPLGFGLAVSAGLVSSIGPHKGELRLFSSAPISPGSSGGGLFDSRGRLVGITTGLYPGAQNLNLAVPADWITELAARGVPKLAVPASAPDPDWIGQAESLRIAGGWVQLIAWARRWLEAYPTSAEAGSYLGFALLKSNQAEEAKQVLLIAQQNDPRSAAVYGYLAEVRYALGEKQAAREDLQRAIVLSPASGYFYLVRASWQRAEEDIQGALESILTSIKLDPGNEFSWDLLGTLYQRQQRNAEAVQAFRSALRLAPNFTQALSNLTPLLATAGEGAPARQALVVAPSHGDPKDAAGWLAVGYAEEKQGRFAEAERAYRKSLEIDPELADAWNSLGLYLIRVRRNVEAEEALRQAVKYRPNFATSWISLGNIILQRGDPAAAREAFESATVAEPKNPGGWFGIGMVRGQLRDYAGAVSPLEQAIKLDPSKSAAWAYLGEMQLRSGQREAALKSLQEAEKLDAKNENALSGLATYYGMTGNPAKALDYALQALSISPASAHHWNSKGYTLMQLRRYPEAIPALETATRLQPDLVAAWINLGEAYLRINQIGKAIPALEQALKLMPQAIDAQMFLSQAYAASGQIEKAQAQLKTLLNQAPNFAPAWGMIALAHLRLGDHTGAVEAYNKLKLINPALAREISLAYRKQNPMSPLQLPE